jgi:hypothetical protein
MGYFIFTTGCGVLIKRPDVVNFYTAESNFSGMGKGSTEGSGMFSLRADSRCRAYPHFSFDLGTAMLF